MPEFSLMCPFLDADPKYAHGCEFGMLYAHMQAAAACEQFGDYYTRTNQDQILLLVARLKWRVVEMKNHDRDWVWIELANDAG